MIGSPPIFAVETPSTKLKRRKKLDLQLSN